MNLFGPVHKIAFIVVLFSAPMLTYAQSLISFEFTSEDENPLIKENDSFKYYIASGDTANTVCLSEEMSLYRLLNKDRKVIAEGNYSLQGDKYQQEGKWTEWYNSGKLKRTGYYMSGLPVGTWQEFYSNGKPKFISNYGIFISKGETYSCLSGSYQEFYQNGKLKVNGLYSAEIKTVHDTVSVTDPVTGHEVKKDMARKVLTPGKAGKWEYYDENGELDKKEDANP